MLLIILGTKLIVFYNFNDKISDRYDGGMM